MSEFHTKGVQFQMEDSGTPGSYLLIPGVNNLSPGGTTATQIEITALNDTARRFLQGIQDYGQATFEIVWDPEHARHQELLTLAAGTDSKNFRIRLPDAATADASIIVLDFAANVEAFEWNFSTDDAARANVTLKVTGAITQGTE
jgi:hypothetical protein